MCHDSVLCSEILQQPDVLARMLECLDAPLRRVAAHIRAFEPEVVLLAARGSSDNAARYAQYLLGGFHRYVVALATPSLFTCIDDRPGSVVRSPSD